MVILSLALAPLLAPVESKTSQNDFPTDHSAGFQIRGSMTLTEIETITGVPAVHILAQLELPASTSHKAKLGSLKRQYPFEMEQVRTIVNQYLAQ